MKSATPLSYPFAVRFNCLYIFCEWWKD